MIKFQVDLPYREYTISEVVDRIAVATKNSRIAVFKIKEPGKTKLTCTFADTVAGRELQNAPECIGVYYNKREKGYLARLESELFAKLMRD
jgi:hypothetical protein